MAIIRPIIRESTRTRGRIRRGGSKLPQMPEAYKRLLDGNRLFVETKLHDDPEFFRRLAEGQEPEFLWIGCSDSRVPADMITRTQPGEIFVTRNIANLVVHTDVSMLSVLDYAVNALKVKHIIVCGHYGCGGVKAAMSNREHGLLDNWLRNIKDVYRLHADELDALEDPKARERRLVELNVIEQVYNVCKTSTVQRAWMDDSFPHVHGWVYDVGEGRLANLAVDLNPTTDLASIYRFQM